MCNPSRTIRRVVLTCLLAGLWLIASTPDQANAQVFTRTWVDVGDFQAQYSNSGGQDEVAIGNVGMQWPAILSIGTGQGSDHINSKGLWIGVTDWTDDAGKTWEYFVNRVGFRGPGQGLAFPVETRLVSSIGDPNAPDDSQPSVLVRGGNSFDKVAQVNEVDPSLEADRMLYHRAHTKVGITMERKVYGFSQEYHDDYHIVEYLYTNTGNVDSDPELELEDQTLNGVLISRPQRVRGNLQAAWVTGGENVWGMYNMVDVVGDGHQEYNVDFRAYYVWPGWKPTFGRDFNSLGASIWDDSPWYVADGDSVGRLAGGSMAGRVTIYGEKQGNAATYGMDEDFPPPEGMDADDLASRDPAERQPLIQGYQDADGRMTSRGEPMEDYYEIALHADGPKQGTYPHHADQVESDGNFATTTGNPSMGRQGGFFPVTTYGPYTLEPGESVRIVVADVVAGLDWDARMAIGMAYKDAGGDDSLHIPYDANGDGTIQGREGDGTVRQPYDESLTKNRWVLTARDSLNDRYERAIANYRSGFDIPDSPPPPRELRVQGRPNRVDLEWDAYSGTEDQIVGWEIYRTSRRVNNLPYTKIAGVDELGPGARSFEDRELQRGIGYFYYVQAVGTRLDEAGPAGTPAGVRLRSGRYYAQTYTPAQLKRPPGTVSEFRVVPNPFNLGSQSTIRWPDQTDKLGFLGIPGQATIDIYTEAGEHVKTIEHTDGSGDEFWNMTTQARQMIVSGVYIAVVTDAETGEQEVRHFTVLR